MAVVWHKTIGDRHYEVRRSGASLRLYTNGVFHSQFNRQYPLAGSVWDLLVLPALMKPTNSVKRVLVLGVGAGAVIRQLQQLVRPLLIVGIEWDAVHLRVAKEIFKVKQHGDVDLHCADAVRWLQAYRGPDFDLVIEDLFIEHQGQPQRAVAADRRWCNLLWRNVSSSGALVMNFDGNQSLRECVAVRSSSVDSYISGGYCLQAPGYENRVAAFMKGKGNKKILSNNLQVLAQQYGAGIRRRMNAEITLLK